MTELGSVAASKKGISGPTSCVRLATKLIAADSIAMLDR